MEMVNIAAFHMDLGLQACAQIFIICFVHVLLIMVMHAEARHHRQLAQWFNVFAHSSLFQPAKVAYPFSQERVGLFRSAG